MQAPLLSSTLAWSHVIGGVTSAGSLSAAATTAGTAGYGGYKIAKGHHKETRNIEAARSRGKKRSFGDAIGDFLDEIFD